MSLDFAEEMMAMKVDPNHKQFARILSIKQSIASSLLVVTARVNAGTLRPANDDGLAELLASLSAESA